MEDVSGLMLGRMFEDIRGGVSLVNKKVKIFLDDTLQCVLGFLQAGQHILARASFLSFLPGNFCLCSL